MLLPQNRLLLWVGFALPFAAIGMMTSSAAVVSISVIALLVVVAGVDAAMARGQLRGIRVELPDVVRLSRNREGTIALRIHREGTNARMVRVGLPFPREISTPNEDFRVALPEGAACSQIAWPCTPSKRGNYRLSRCQLEVSSPMGFWSARSAMEVASEIRVYPNLLDDRKRLAAIFLNRGSFGVHAQRMIGQGRDFEKLRDYIPGDSYDQIHWKATAKRGCPVTKVFQVERTQEVYVILDYSRLSGRKLDNDTVLERFITAALVLGLVAEQQGDLFGLLTFSDRVSGFVRARNGRAHYDSCRDTLYTLHPKRVTPDFAEVCAFIRQRLRRRALLVFLTDLDDPVVAESLVKNVDLIARQHLILISAVRSRNAEPIFKSESAASLDDVYRHLGGHLLWQRAREVGKVLQRHGVRMLHLDDEKMSAQLVSQYLTIKQRQLL